MPNYRFYTGHQQIDPLVIDFASDQEAIDKARRLLSGLDIEVWQGARVVIRLRRGYHYPQEQTLSPKDKAINLFRRMARNCYPIRTRLRLRA